MSLTTGRGLAGPRRRTGDRPGSGDQHELAGCVSGDAGLVRLRGLGERERRVDDDLQRARPGALDERTAIATPDLGARVRRGPPGSTRSTGSSTAVPSTR